MTGAGPGGRPPGTPRSPLRAEAAAGAGLAEECAQLLARVTERVEQVLTSVTGLAATAEFIAEAARLAERPLRRDDFAALQPLAESALRAHPDLAAGTGVVLAPGTLADAPRCIEWWWADQQGRVSQLHVDLNPESAEFYDYTSTEWYREPERTGQPWMAGPYVDFICTRQYTFTLAAPVCCAGRFIGIAGADILAGQVERLVLPGLARLGRTAVLTSGHGRVIASNSPGIPPGSPVARQPQAADLVPVAGPGDGRAGRLLPWTVLSTRGGRLGA
jgi:hypothetical protein